jgi:threonine dehydrogenase-like Zn-dependent dehydrogenase
MRMMALNAARLPLEQIVSHRMPLERAEEALELAQGNESMKVVFAPNTAPASA